LYDNVGWSAALNCNHNSRFGDNEEIVTWLLDLYYDHKDKNNEFYDKIKYGRHQVFWDSLFQGKMNILKHILLLLNNNNTDDQKCQKNMINDRKYCAFSVLCMKGDWDKIKFLLSLLNHNDRLDLICYDDGGQKYEPMIHLFLNYYDYKNVKYILKHFDVNRNNDNKKEYEEEEENNDDLIKYDCEWDSEFEYYDKVDEVEDIEQTYDKKRREIIGFKESKLFQYAVQRGDFKMVKLLLYYTQNDIKQQSWMIHVDSNWLIRSIKQKYAEIYQYCKQVPNIVHADMKI